MAQGKLRVGLLQTTIQEGDPDANFQRIADYLEKAVKSEPAVDVLMLPEMWNTGYALHDIGRTADKDGERTKRLLKEFSSKHRKHIVGGSVAERSGEAIRNSCYIYNREGKVAAAYSKIHLFGLMGEDQYLQPGAVAAGFEMEGVSCGAIICYDLRFPELPRKLALGGAKLLFVPAQWPTARLHVWRTLLMARAIENQCFVIGCNRTGAGEKDSFPGHSLIADPWGEVIAEAESGEGWLFADLELSVVDRARAAIPVFRDRRPELY